MPSIHTVAVHAGERTAQPGFTPVATPIYHSSSYVYDEMETLDATFAGTFDGPMYTRYGNPTVSALEAAVAALEGGEAALAYGSGHGGDPRRAAGRGRAGGDKCGGGAGLLRRDLRVLLSRLLASQGVTPRFVDIADFAAVEDAFAAARGDRRAGRRCSSRRSPTRCSRWPTARAGGAGARRRRRADRGQHLRVRRICAGRWRWARIMSSTARPSTWAGTATCWAAWS